jgi:hypothetical protein
MLRSRRQWSGWRRRWGDDGSQSIRSPRWLVNIRDFARIAADFAENMVLEEPLLVSAHNRAIAASKPLPWAAVTKAMEKEKDDE